MATLTALQRTFAVVTPRNNAAQGQFQELKTLPQGSVQVVGLNWSPIVKDLYDSTISSSTWSQSGNTVSLASAANDTITSQVTVTAGGAGLTMLQNNVVLANGITLVHYVRINVIDLNADVDTVSVPTAGSGIDHGGLLGLSDDDHTQYVEHTDIASNGLVARTSSGNYNSRTISGATGLTVTNGNGVAGNPVIDYDINSLAEVTPDIDDFTVIYDTSGAAHKKASISNVRALLVCTVGETIAQGSMVYMHTDGKIYKADATGTPAQATVIGVTTAAATLDDVIEVITYGPAPYLSGLSVGVKYYLSTTPGGVSSSVVTGSGDNVVYLGVALSSTSINFMPQFIVVRD